MQKQLIVLREVVERTLVALAALVIAVAGLLGTALFTPRLFLLNGIALVALIVTNFVGQTVRSKRRLPARSAAFSAATTLLLAAFFTGTFLLPSGGERLPALPGIQYWQLPTGSRLGYLKLTPEVAVHPEPVVFLHGGPGVADLQGDAAYFGQLSKEGYVVYVYDQLGTGYSSRLQDPTGYTIERNAADLEEIRKQIGAERMILIAHSYGAGIAALYIAQHGEHVAKVIVSSPGSLVGGLADGGGPQARLTTAQTIALYAQLLQPRGFTTYTLLQINPQAAHSFAGDSEMDARMDDVYALTEPGLHCTQPEAVRPLRGLGFYANQFPQSAQAQLPQDFRPALQRYTIPTLVIKGSCDYLTWQSAVAYLDAFHAGPAHMVYLPGAGHNAYQDLPHEYAQNIKAFLNDEPLPNGRSDRNVPADYEMGR